MKSMRHSVLLALCLAFCGNQAHAAWRHVRSDGFTHGSIAGQVTNAGGFVVWSGGAQKKFTNHHLPGQDEITSDAAHSGSNSWRFSCGYGSEGQGTPFSPRLWGNVSVGQPSSGADADVFEISFWFKVVSPNVNTQRMQVVAGATSGTDRASNYFQLRNVPGTGVLARTAISTGGWNAAIIILTSGVDSAWHKMDITGRFYDGPTNDMWTYVMDGIDLGTYPAYFEAARDYYGYTYEKTWWLKFQPRYNYIGTNQGFYFDDVYYRAYRSSDSNDILASYYTSFEAKRYRRLSSLTVVR